MSGGSTRWWLGRAPAVVVLTLAALLGGWLALDTFGAAYLSGGGPFWKWPAGDASMMLTGWRYFAHEPWRFPLADIASRHPPDRTNILYFDAIPLVALIAKALRPVLGSAWNPYGIWHGLVYVLQGVLGALLARRMGIKSILGGLAFALIVLSNAAFILRFYHEGLNGQFVLLWALLAYLRTDASRGVLGPALEWAACLSCAVLLHPYLGAMAGAVAVAAFLRWGERRAARALSAASASAAIVLGVLVLCGYLPQSLPPSAGDFGRASLNWVSLAVPIYSSLVPNVPLAPFQDMTGYQWDGANFLGIAGLALVALVIAFAPRALVRLVKRHKFLFAIFVVLTLYAPGNHWYFARTALFSYRVPAFALPVTSILRATGRVFWVVTYAILAVTSALVVRRFGRRGTVLVLVLALVQFADSAAAREVVHRSMTASYPTDLDWGALGARMRSFRQVNVYPSYSCWPMHPGERVLQSERELELLATSRGLATNGGRTARPLSDCAREVHERDRAARGELDPGVLYFFYRPVYSDDLLDAMGRNTCERFTEGYVCHAGR